MTKSYLKKTKIGFLAVMLSLTISGVLFSNAFAESPEERAAAAAAAAAGTVTYDTPTPPAGVPAPPRTEPTPITVVGDNENPILKLLHEFVVTFFGWIVVVAGITFDYSITAFTIGFEIGRAHV